MKKRTREQLQASKSIYAKHAARHKVNDYPYERCKRMLAYTAALTKAIAKAGGVNGTTVYKSLVEIIE